MRLTRVSFARAGVLLALLSGCGSVTTAPSDGGGTGGGKGGGSGGGSGGAGGAGGTGTGGKGGAGTGGTGGSGPCQPGQTWCPGCTPGTGTCVSSGGGCPGFACPPPDAGCTLSTCPVVDASVPPDAKPSPCAQATSLADCDARTDCHAVFVDLRTCGCAQLGCCAHFSRCADGDRAACKGTPLCEIPTPYCEGPYVISYTATCYDGCVRAAECAP
jgi:hypothetical protein